MATAGDYHVRTDGSTSAFVRAGEQPGGLREALVTARERI